MGAGSGCLRPCPPLSAKADETATTRAAHPDKRICRCSLLTLSTGPAAGPCQAVDHVAAAHLDAVRAKISDLRRLELILVSVLDQCGRTTVEACCVLDALRAPSAEDGVRPAFVTTV